MNLTLVYFSRVGSCQTKPLLPPSSRCSITTSQPRPSQLLKVPRSLSSILTAKQTLSAGIRVVHRCSLLAQIREQAGPFAVEPQFGLQPRGQRAEQLTGQLVERRAGRCRRRPVRRAPWPRLARTAAVWWPRAAHCRAMARAASADPERPVVARFPAGGVRVAPARGPRSKTTEPSGSRWARPAGHGDRARVSVCGGGHRVDLPGSAGDGPGPSAGPAGRGGRVD